MHYPQRLETLLRHRIGLWDVIASCRRPGSLDADIRDEQRNDFSFLQRDCPELTRVCFNGQKAARLARLFASLGYETILLPSSSPAFTLSYAEKLQRWQDSLAVIAPHGQPCRS